MEHSVESRMRAEWNARATEDAHYYVAFGRREQDDDEFFATAKDLVGELVSELKRLPPETPGKMRRALEIGCGPGRLLRPMSRYFDQIYGVDVSDAMVKLAREKLAGVPNAFPYAIAGSDLKMFPDAHFDFVYSY
ncbi:MAG TPA: class I SAM-dependent methyltransferase, partial [Bryobacteraceae bacterium]|nr:class I SAM-dependent methyltransferase [Bryobacteraceae bacterium]